MAGIVRVRPGPVRFHSDCKSFNPDTSRCDSRECKVQAQELACKNVVLRFEENHERFRCTHCGVAGPAFKSIWVRTEFMSDGTPMDIYKCESCNGLTVLYQTDKAQKCRKLSDVITN